MNKEIINNKIVELIDYISQEEPPFSVYCLFSDDIELQKTINEYCSANDTYRTENGITVNLTSNRKNEFGCLFIRIQETIEEDRPALYYEMGENQFEIGELGCGYVYLD